MTATTVEPALVCEDISVRFGGQYALRDVSFSVPRDGILGIVGPNGAGKTTMLNVISRLVVPETGQVHAFGEDLLAVPAHRVRRLGIARAFQLADQCGSLTVLEYMLLGLQTFSSSLLKITAAWPSARREENVSAAAAVDVLRDHDLGGIDPLAKLQELPYGIRKRIDVARVWFGRPRLVLLDEPTSGLSDSEAARTVGHLKELIEEQECAVVVVDHRVGFVREVCPEVLVLDFGHVLAAGPCEDVFASGEVRRAYLGTA